MMENGDSRKNRVRKVQFIWGIIILLIICIGFWVFNRSTEQEAQSIVVGNENKSANEEKTEPIKEEGVTKQTAASIKEQKIADLMAKMTLREKIGQLLVVGFDSTTIDKHITTMISEYNVGGVILFDRNMETQGQVASLNKQLQQLSVENENGIPLILSIDQEGGQIVRMRDQVSPIPSQQELGQGNDAQEVYNVALRTGNELKSMGFNVNFAPVLDLSEKDSRSFGKEPEKASNLGRQVIAGMKDSGITATLKHFPGNGRMAVNPHVETSSVQADKLDLENQDIYPFKKIINEIDNNQFFVMVTHIKYPAYDKDNPASMSSIIIQDLLRKQLGFKGIVVTDDLEMGAVNKYYTYEDLGYRAIESGADLLLVCHTFENQKKVFDGILNAVETNKISEERIDESVKRILMHKFTSVE